VLINFYAAWIGILMGFLAGALEGLFFHSEQWRGGYSSWPRRMVRLGHISFLGIGFINLGYSFSISYLNITNPSHIPSILFLTGAVSMPAVCYLSACKKAFRHLFFIPAGSLIIGAGAFIFLELFR